MCLALPGRVLGVNGKEALVDFDGIRKNVNAEFIKVRKGDKVMVFNNFVIERL
jgi:hydrogenase expression/formation protein HypC